VKAARWVQKFMKEVLS